MREVHESMRILIGGVRGEQMANFNNTVEALLQVPASRKKEDTTNALVVCCSKVYSS